MVNRLLALFSIFSVIWAGFSPPASAVSWTNKVDPWVLNSASLGDSEFLVYLASQADLSGVATLSTRSEKGWYVYRSLTSIAEKTQPPLVAELKRLGVAYRPYWVANMIWVRGSLSTVQQLALRSDVAHLYANPSVVNDIPATSGITTAQNSAPQGVEWNINWVNAPQVWALGDTGQGIVLGGQDTGYDWDHPALLNQYRGWNGAAADHDYNWHDAIHAAVSNPCGSDSPLPCDDNGHGTHTMGIMLGGDGASNQVGMAPGARWIGCRNMDQGVGKPSTYAECYQWFIAPTRLDGSDPRPDLAPDVINNSWSCPPSEGCNPESLALVVQNLVAAGIVSVHSAGNNGSACSSISEPAAIYAESFTVGATGYYTDTIASFSSRGPVTVDGSSRPKPDISAPGVNIRSSVPGGGYAIMQGTSMAAPHVAGLVALLISAQPALRGDVPAIESAIEQSGLHIPSTECGSSGVPNNTYGWGRIDALAAFKSLHQVKLVKTASAPSVMPGDTITYTLTITNMNQASPITNVVLTDTIPLGTSFISASPAYTQVGNVIQWAFPSLSSLLAVSVQMVVQSAPDASGTITNASYAVRSDQSALFQGSPVSTLVGRQYFLPLLANSP
jgi:serine protease AprX